MISREGGMTIFCTVNNAQIAKIDRNSTAALEYTTEDHLRHPTTDPEMIRVKFEIKKMELLSSYHQCVHTNKRPAVKNW